MIGLHHTWQIPRSFVFVLLVDKRSGKDAFCTSSLICNGIHCDIFAHQGNQTSADRIGWRPAAYHHACGGARFSHDVLCCAALYSRKTFLRGTDEMNGDNIITTPEYKVMLYIIRSNGDGKIR